MSVRHIGLVLDRLEAPAPVKLLALILADHCDSDGFCWPSYRRLAERSCLSERSVRRHVAGLIAAGLLAKVRTGHVTTRDGRRLRVTNAYRLSVEALEALPTLLSTAPAVPDHLEMATSDHSKGVAGGQGRWSGVATKPSEEPSIPEEHSLSETSVPDPPKRVQRVSAKRDADWQGRAEEILAKTAFPEQYRQLAELLAEANRTGRAALSRVVRELYEPLLELERDVGPEAMRAGLRAATSRAAPNANYVRKAATSHARRPASVAVTSKTIDRSDYDDFCTGGEP